MSVAEIVKIAFVVPALHKHGGTERCTASLAEALTSRGHEVVIFATTKCDRILPSAKWHRIPIVPRPHIFRFISFLLMNTLFRLVDRVLKGEHFDIVHSTGPDVLSPTVTTFHSCSLEFAKRLWSKGSESSWQRVAWLRRWTNLLAYSLISLCERYVARKGAGRVIAVSEVLATELRTSHGLERQRLVVVPNGVDLAEFGTCREDAKRAARADLGLAGSEVVVLFVGHNFERKGLETLVAAMQAVRADLQRSCPWLVVVGGHAQPSYEEGVRTRLSGNVTFLGIRTDMGRIYGLADVLVLPTTHEPYGLPVLEAMACGLTVIVSRCAGVAEIITDGVDGMLLDDPADSSELARRLKLVVSSAELRKAIGEEARRTAGRYSWATIADQIEAVYRDAVTSQGNSLSRSGKQLG